MICFKCQSKNVRLKGLSGFREIWVCDDCNQPLTILDCHYCERRGVHKVEQREAGDNLWRCQYCHVEKTQCPDCSKGWLVKNDEQRVCDSCSVIQ